jgi:hypothetical protein
MVGPASSRLFNRRTRGSRQAGPVCCAIREYLIENCVFLLLQFGFSMSICELCGRGSARQW